MSKDFVNAIATGNNIEAEKVFKHDMGIKIGDSLEVKRKELASTFVQSMTVNTDTEETDDSEV
jgi:hypothetical protein